MLRTSLTTLSLLLLLLPSLSGATDNLAILESVVAANSQVQPGLQNFHARVETSRIKEMMTNLTKGIPDDVKAPPTPVIYKFWQRNGKGFVYAKRDELTPYVRKIVKQVTASLAIELNNMLLPADRVEQRSKLVKQATLKASEVTLADNMTHHLEIIFDKPTDLGEAFYVEGMRLPQKQVKSLTFDVDSRKKTVSEMKIVTGNGLQLAVEIRYIDVVGGYLPERFQVTSPDGKVDDLFEVKFSEIDGFMLPSSMLRTIRRPALQEDLEIFFKDYQINQPISADMQNRLKEQ